jgi:plasmid stabilization system protein ParE
VASLEWSERALASLDQLVVSHSLPADTRERIEASARPLARFPRLGPELRALDDGWLRFLIGPWPWLVIVYLYLEAEERVVVVSVEDGRAATATIMRARDEPPTA